MSTRFGIRLKRLRQTRELTQRTLAAKVGVTEAYISMLEGGQKKNPSLDVLKQLSKALKVSVVELLG